MNKDIILIGDAGYRNTYEPLEFSLKYFLLRFNSATSCRSFQINSAGFWTLLKPAATSLQNKLANFGEDYDSMDY